MKKLNIINIKSLSIVPLLLILAAPVHAANLSVRGVSVLDMTGVSRSAFTNTEKIILRQKVYNQTASLDKVKFKFIIYDPAQTAVFLHSGNAAPGSIGQAQAQVAGIPISGFYRSPGAYKLTAKAELDGETVIQEISFTVSSPNIILTYPPNGARNLIDMPLIFRWISSGASRYRFTVGEDPACSNPVMFQQENNGENYFTYPQIVPARQNLVPGKTYYWKVEGLDAAGNIVAESGVPSNFSIKQAASRVRNVSVISLEMGTAGAEGDIPFNVIVKNQGGSTETGISAKFTLGGMPAINSPQSIQTLESDRQAELEFKAFIPPDQDQSLAVACIDTPDDVPADNCKSKLVSRETTYGDIGGPGRTLTYEELWEIIKKYLGDELAGALEGYSLDTIICENCQGSELADFIAALINGESQIVWSDIPKFKKPPTAVARAGAPGALGAAEAPSLPARKRDKLLKEWAGRTEAFPSKKASTFIVRGRKEWKKFWTRLAAKRSPKVDFSEFMAVGIVAGKDDRASDARILDAQEEALTLVVTYYIIEVTEKRKLEDQAYRVKLVRRTDKEVEFREIK